jgi:uncharacterized protein Ymh
MTTPAQRLTYNDSQPFNVSLSRGIIELALQGFQRYRPMLEKLTGIESQFGLQQSPLAREIQKIDNLIAFCKKHLEEMQDLPFAIFTIYYGDLRWLKAGMLLRIDELRALRDTQFAKYTSLPVSLVQAINARIAECENLAESGMFNSMVPHLLTFDSTMPAPIKVQVADSIAQDPKGPLVVMRVELLDEGLRRRCGDLYEQFAADPTHQDRFDTVLRDASVVIESRIREATGLAESLIGEALLAKALAADTGELIFSNDKNEQKAVHLLFLGFFGFIRNSVNHRLVPTYTKERAAQVLGMADYLLFLLSQGRRRNSQVLGAAG